MDASRKFVGDEEYSTEFEDKVILYGGQYGKGHPIDRDVIALPKEKYGINDRVVTTRGPGAVKAIERHYCLVHPLVRFGVLHDAAPDSKILYYAAREVNPQN